MVNVYQKAILASVPFLLSHLDRQESSPTFGSFDRQHWAWANKDFANADFQRGALILATLHETNFSGNFCYQSPRILNWALAAADYWCRLQNSNGSFDQWYPNEYSAGTTGFTLGPMVETVRMLSGHVGNSRLEKFRKTADAAATFLCRVREEHGFISNHQAGIALALYRAGDFLGNPKYLREASSIVDLIARHQASDGFFSEYGGADPGYETLGLYYLAAIYEETHEERILAMLRRSLDFLTYFIHPNCTIGGEYGSRNTELYYPAGFEMLASVDTRAAAIALAMRPALKDANHVHPSNVDIFNFFPIASNYATASRFCRNIQSNFVLPAFRRETFSRAYSEAGILVHKARSYYAIAGIKKGGTLRVYHNSTKRLLFCDAGTTIRLKNGQLLSNQALHPEFDFERTSSGFILTASFFPMVTNRMAPFSHLLLRIFTITFGRSTLLGNLMKSALSNILIRSRKPAALILRREVLFHEKEIKISDIFEGDIIKVQDFRIEAKANTVFMGSSRYFARQELDTGNEVTVDRLVNGQKILVRVQ